MTSLCVDVTEAEVEVHDDDRPAAATVNWRRPHPSTRSEVLHKSRLPQMDPRDVLHVHVHSIIHKRKRLDTCKRATVDV